MWWLSNNDIEVLYILFLICPENVCIERIQNRGGDRVDDNIDTIKKRFKSLKEETEPTVIKLKNYGPVYEIKKAILPEEINEGINGIIFSSKKDSNIIQIWFKDYNKNYYIELEQMNFSLINVIIM